MSARTFGQQPLAIGSVAAIVRLSSAYVAGLLNLIPVFIIRKGKARFFNIAGSQTKGLEREVAERVISADGYLGVNALSGGVQGEVTPAQGVGGETPRPESKADPLVGSLGQSHKPQESPTTTGATRGSSNRQ